MIEKIGFIHTGSAIVSIFEKLMKEKLPQKHYFNLVDDSIIKDLLNEDKDLVNDLNTSSSIVRRISRLVIQAAEAGADVIMFTCSSISPVADIADKLVDIPVYKVDAPMADAAISMGKNIGILATAKTTLNPSVNLILKKAELKGKNVNVESLLISEAFNCFLKGDMEEHDRLIIEKGIKLIGKVDVIILAQASMSHLAEGISKKTNVPVLTSPPLAVEFLKSRSS